MIKMILFTYLHKAILHKGTKFRQELHLKESRPEDWRFPFPWLSYFFSESSCRSNWKFLSDQFLLRFKTRGYPLPKEQSTDWGWSICACGSRLHSSEARAIYACADMGGRNCVYTGLPLIVSTAYIRVLRPRNLSQYSTLTASLVTVIKHSSAQLLLHAGAM